MNIFVAVLLLFVGASAARWSDKVFKFSIEEELKDVLPNSVEEEDALLHKLLMNHGNLAPSRLGAFSWTDCSGTQKKLYNLTKLVVSPDPLSFPGTLTVDFQGTFKETLDSPLKAGVLLERRVGTTWIKIPCLGMIGSCTYDDLCQLLQGAVCPDPFVENNVPCKCPFLRGTYQLPSVNFEIDAAVFPPGDYHAQANLTYGSAFVGCLDLNVSFA